MNINDVFSWANHLEMVEYQWLRFFQKTGMVFGGKSSLESSGIPNLNIFTAYQEQASIGTATIFETPSSWAFTWNTYRCWTTCLTMFASGKKPGIFSWRQSHGLGMGAVSRGWGWGLVQEGPSYSTVDDATPSDLFLDFLTSWKCYALRDLPFNFPTSLMLRLRSCGHTCGVDTGEGRVQGNLFQKLGKLCKETRWPPKKKMAGRGYIDKFTDPRRVFATTQPFFHGLTVHFVDMKRKKYSSRLQKHTKWLHIWIHQIKDCSDFMSHNSPSLLRVTWPDLKRQEIET